MLRSEGATEAAGARDSVHMQRGHPTPESEGGQQVAFTGMSQALVIAHRGASATFPENTLEAFRGAAEQGADWVELDARRTADRALVVHHDALLPDGRAVVELAASDLPASVPSLAEALDACAGMGVNIEIKNNQPDPDFDVDEHVAEATVALLAERGGRDEVLISSFNPATVVRVRQRDPRLATALLVIEPEPQVVDLVSAAGHQALHPYDWFVDEDLVDRCHAAGVRVNVWTVDDADRMVELLALGVDGLCTNVPAVARALIPRA
jgi:glycerophosphoryl diester phosphodiesterase